MTDMTALDKVVERVRTAARMYPSLSLDALVKDARFIMDINFPLALQDPRFLDYCKEQDEVCEKCGDAGWLWADELDHYYGDNPSFDDTKYSCDGPTHKRRKTK